MKLFLDSCAIIYMIEGTEKHYRSISLLLQSIRKKYGAIPFLISELSLLECRIKPLREKQKEIINHYQQFFQSSDLISLPISRLVIDTATLLRVNYYLKSPDAIQAASALTVPDEIIFITGDRKFKKITELKVELI